MRRHLVPACIFLKLRAPSNQLIPLHSSTCSIDSGAEPITSLSMIPGNIVALIIASPIQSTGPLGMEIRLVCDDLDDDAKQPMVLDSAEFTKSR